MRTSAGPELPPRRKVSLPHLNTNLPANAFGRRPSLPYGDNQPSSSFSPSNLLPLPQDCALHPLTSPKVLSRPPAALPDESTSTDRHSRVGRTASFDSGRGSIVSCGSLESEASNGVFSPVRLKKCEGSLTAEDGCYPEKTFISPTEPSPGCSARSRPLPAIPPVAKSSAHPPPPPPPVKRKPSVPVPPV